MENVNPDADLRDAMIQFAQAIPLSHNQLSNWNLSEKVAIKRILQIPQLGLFSNDVSSKLYKPDWKTPDLDPDDKEARKLVYEEFMKKCEQEPNLKAMKWTLVLFRYQIYPGSSGSPVIWDSFDYDEIARVQAQRFINALSYAPGIPPVEWYESPPTPPISTLTVSHLFRVRSTYTTLEHPHLHPRLFDFSQSSSLPSLNGVPALIHLTTSSLVPSFTRTDLARIDQYLKAFKFLPPPDSKKQKVVVPDDREHLPHPGKPIVLRCLGPPFNPEVKRECQGCGKLLPFGELKYCTGCYGVFFCSNKCQKANWKVHKLVCCPRSVQ
ncbi:zinc finger MYND domain-containing protein [Sporobolomyces salmoneus]|uniref:zinc finger MYND domain-containing protein n=1 Tax=Sporobolomyces salmoneus TaxID=183962 RepID=UPI0031806A49